MSNIIIIRDFMKDSGFSIQFVSQVTGINAHTLRAWEKRYAAVVPKRNAKAKRLYSEEDIEKLKLLGSLTQLGSSIGDIASLPTKELAKLADTYGIEPQKEKFNPEIDTTQVLKNLLMALHGFKLDIISHEMEKIKNDLGPRDFSLRLLVPLLGEVGKMVFENKLSIAQEHAMSAIIKFHAGSILYKELGSTKSRKSIILATPEGELHEFGIMISALLCAHYNLRFIYLGANMPSDALADASNQINADIVLVGVSSMFQSQNSEFLEEYFQALRGDLSCESDLWIGGLSNQTKQLMQDGITLVESLERLDEKLQAEIS